jgi:beta-galactosidase
MVQVENEYGSFGSDKEYLELNRKLFVKAGFDGILYTCDPRNDIGKGHLPGLLPAINGVDKPEDVRKLISENHNGKGPFILQNGILLGLTGGEQNTTPFLFRNMLID